MKRQEIIISNEIITNKIYLIRNQKVMLDRVHTNLTTKFHI